MSPGRLCETAILTSADWGSQTPGHRLNQGQSSGRPVKGLVPNVSARNIGSRGAAVILDYINCAAEMIRLNQQYDFGFRDL